MEMLNFDRMENPLDVQPGLDELPGFVPDDAYWGLKAACAEAFEAMHVQRIHRYSIAELKQLIDRYADLASKADAVMSLYAANDAFICRHIDICERYADLEDYMQVSDRFTTSLFESSEIRSIQEVVQLKDAHSAMYEQVYFVAEFSDFRFHFEICKEAALFLSLDTKNVQTALRDFNYMSELGWINYYQELFERINEMLGLNYFPFNTEYRPYFYVQCFKVAKEEVSVMLEFLAKMGELRHAQWKMQLTVK